jgi:hypothetical protein
LFKMFFAAFTKKVSKLRNMNHIQLSHCCLAIAVFQPSTRPRLMQADAGFYITSRPGGQLLTQAGPGRARAGFQNGGRAGPLRNTGKE